MKRPALLLALGLGALGLGVDGIASPAQAGESIYQYTIKHAQYGDVGTYTNIIDQSGDRTDVTTRVHVLVKALGIVLYRQNAERIEHWNKGRLIAFQGVTETNGKRSEIRGHAEGDAFVVETPHGTAVAPAEVRPSNPWSVRMFHGDALMSTTSGRIFWPDVKRTEDTRDINGHPARLHRIDVIDEKHQIVWFDGENVPVAFQTQEDGETVDFVLTQRRVAASTPDEQRAAVSDSQ